MLFPIRCFTCGKLISHLHKTYELMLTDKVPIKDALDKLNVKRYCCRRMFLTHTDTFKYISEFDKRHFFYIHNNLNEVEPIIATPNTNSNTGFDCINEDNEDDIQLDDDIHRGVPIDDEYIPDDETIIDEYE